MPTSLASSTPWPRQRLAGTLLLQPLQAHANLTRAFDDVRVGHNVAVVGQNHAGADAALRLEISGVVLVLVGGQTEADGQHLYDGLGNRAGQLLH